MRLAAPVCALCCAILLPVAAKAALGIEELTPSTEKPAVSQSEFSEGTAEHYEKARNFRLQQQRRSTTQGQVRGAALIVGPVALIVLVTFLYAKSKSGGSKRSTHRKLKSAEARRRAGEPDQMIDPRQW